VRVRAEQEHRPDDEGGGGLLPRAKEGLALVDHLVGGQRPVAPCLPLRRPRLQYQPEQVVAVSAAAAAAVVDGVVLGGHPRLHHRHDLVPHQLVQAPHLQVAPSRQIPDKMDKNENKSELVHDAMIDREL